MTINNLNQYQLIIFDWDGTLMDSIGRIVSCMRTAAKLMQQPVPLEDEVKQIIGLSLAKAVDVLFPQCDAQQQQKLIEHYHHQYIEEDTTPTPLFENAVDLLEQLEKNNKIIAVATGKARAGLERVMSMSDTKHFFKTSRCADEANSKPDPDMLHQILAELNISPDKAIMIGDTSHDLKMAQAAGIASIGVTFGVHSKAVLNKFNPITVVDSLAQMQSLFHSK